MIAPMDRVEIVCLRSELRALIPLLQEQGVMHVEQVPLALENHPGFLHRVHLPEDEKRELAELETIDGLLKEAEPLLARKPSHAAVVEAGKEMENRPYDARLKAARQWHRTLRTLHRRRLNIQDNIAVIKNYGRLIEFITPLLISQGATLGETARAIVLEGYTAEQLEALQRDITTQAGPDCDYMTKKLDRNKVVLVITHPADQGEAVAAVLGEKGIRTVTSPDQEARGASVDEVMRKIGGRVAELQADLDAVQAELDTFSEQEGASLAALSQIVRDRIAQLHVVDDFAQSELVGVVHGWVPSASYETLTGALEARFGDKVLVEKMDHHDVEHNRIPTKLENHPVFKPFELIMKMMKPATYGSFDPTWLVAASFILFYGFVLGDAGYGLVIVGIGALVKKKWGHIAPLRDGMTIFQYMGASSIVFGIIYWEIFGDFVEVTVGDYSIFHRVHHTDQLLYAAVFFGLVHIPLSLVLGIKEGYAHGHSKHAQEKLGMLLGLGALGAALVSATGYFPLGAAIGYVLALLLFASAAYYLIRGMGALAPMGAMEIVGLTANILSYSRLMALGIASIAFADIANNLPEMIGGGTAGVLLGIPAALCVHILNICIGVFSPTIHSLRLNFVEFLPKFYEADGRNYKPFRKELVW